MIPKIIHYCWFGGKPLPELAQKCIVSWRKYLPEYEIKEWNESNFDVNCIPYTREAYKAKKYAFVSDYARFKILYEEGGLYFDTDVEVIKSMDDIISKGPFMGCERDGDELADITPSVAPGLGLGAIPGLGLYKDLLDLYATLRFSDDKGKLNLKTVVDYTTEIFCKQGLLNTKELQQVAGIWIYPKEYFNPISHVNELNITNNTYSIHHYAGTWLPASEKLKNRIIKIAGRRLWNFINKLRSKL